LSHWKHAAAKLLGRADRLRGPAPGAEDLSAIRNFLVLQVESPLGSIVHTLPLYRAIRLAVPTAFVTVAASPMAAGVLQHQPEIDRLVNVGNPTKELCAAVLLVRRMGQEMPPGPRAVLTPAGNRRPRATLLALAAGRCVRVGHTLYPELYDCAIPFAGERAQIELNLDILRALGHSAPSSEPEMFFTAADAAAAEIMLSRPAGAPEQPRIALVTQNSGGQRNQWLPERFAEVARALIDRYTAMPVFTGVETDEPSIRALQAQLPSPGVSLAGRTTIPQLAAALAQCDLIISLDTGTFHVARAVGLPGVVLAPAWQDPREWLPVNNPRYRVLRGPTLASAPLGYCMEETSAAAVLAAADELLRRLPSSEESRRQRVERRCIPVAAK
jgi:ADP-heptose:LPS heptosyltransferase